MERSKTLNQQVLTLQIFYMGKRTVCHKKNKEDKTQIISHVTNIEARKIYFQLSAHVFLPL